MKGHGDIEKFHELFPDPDLARDLFNILEDYRIESRLKAEYPVLGDQISEINIHTLSKRPFLEELTGDKEKTVEIIGQKLIAGKTNEKVPDSLTKALDYALSVSETLVLPDADIHEAARIAAEIYFFLDEAFKDDYVTVSPFSTLLDQSKAYRDAENFGIISKKNRKKERNRKTKSSSNDETDDHGQEEVQKKENQPRSPHPPKNKGNNHKPDFNQMLPFQPTGLQGKGELEDKAKKSFRAVFNENGIRPKNIESKDDSPEPYRLGEHVRSLTSSVTDNRELEKELGTFLYPEWGHDIGGYRVNWSKVRERELIGDSTEFYQATLKKHAGLIKTIKREFQMLRPEKLLKIRRQYDGDEIDLDSIVEYFIDRKLGITPSEKNYIRTKKKSRDIAVSFLIDMSGSTKGSTIVFEKEALVIMTEALNELGDAFSIYGFSGHTRENVDFYIIKEFDDAYGRKIEERLSAIEYKFSTRIGAAIRHTAAKLVQRDERVKMIILLSDGKPEDKEYYERYGIEDTRMALKEAQRCGIKPFCITVDSDAAEYLHRMYSHSSWVVFNDMSKLPLKISRIYRRLTT